MNKNNEEKHTMKFIRTNRMIIATAAIAFALGIPSAQALNITIGDGVSSGGSGQGSEVGETEPGTIVNHSWDLEAFAIKGDKLVLISGFNLLNGNDGFASGDIFINASGALQQGTTLSGGNGYKTISGNMGFEFVLDLNIAGGNFNVVNIGGSGVTLLSGYYRQNDKSNPFQYVSGGTTAYANQGLSLTTGLSTAQVQTLYGADIATSGENNYAIELDMSWWGIQFPDGNPLDTHFTIGCGNDNIIGEVVGGFDTRVPDGGSTVLLLGLGLVGLVLMGRRYTVKA